MVSPVFEFDLLRQIEVRYTALLAGAYILRSDKHHSALIIRFVDYLHQMLVYDQN